MTSNDPAGIEGNPAYTIRVLHQLGISPLVVSQITCSTYSFTSFDPTSSTYWAERWLFYVQRYGVARWLWLYGVTDIETWNEPDLTANNACITYRSWIDYYTLSNTAFQNAYADMNADLNNNVFPTTGCPVTGACTPLKPYLIASAFAHSTFNSSGSSLGLGYETVANEHYSFPHTYSASWYNLQAFSFHNYGNTGLSLAQSASSLRTQANAVHDTSNGVSPLPVHVTEHAMHTSSDWQGLLDSADDSLAASRLAMQILLQAKQGFASVLYKFSMTPSGTTTVAGAVVKSGIMFGDNTNAPFRIGDSTASGEAARLIIDKVQGSRPLFHCQVNVSTTNTEFRDCLSIGDNSGLLTYVLIVNDADATSSSAKKQPYSYNLTMPLTALGSAVSVGSTVFLSQYSNELAFGGWLLYHGEVSSVVTLGSGLTVSAYVPAGAVLAFTITKNAQTIASVSPVDDTTLVAGNLASKSSLNTQTTLMAGTSTSTNHNLTNVAALQFVNLPVFAIANAVHLELTVANVGDTRNATILSVIGVCSPQASWTTGSLSWNSAGFVLGGIPKVSLVNHVSSDFVNFTAPGVSMVGHITVNPSDANVRKRVDVTKFVQSANCASVAFFIVRRVRSNSYLQSTVNTGRFVPADNLNHGKITAFYSSEYASTDATKTPSLRYYVDPTATQYPTAGPVTAMPSVYTTAAPRIAPSVAPSKTPTNSPTITPSRRPTTPTTAPTRIPTKSPTRKPT